MKYRVMMKCFFIVWISLLSLPIFSDENVCKRFLHEELIADVSFIHDVEHSSIEYAFSKVGQLWIGSIIKLSYANDDNPLIYGLDNDDDQSAVQSKLVSNIIGIMVGSGVYERVDDIEHHEIGGRIVTTLVAEFGGRTDRHAVKGFWVGLEFMYFNIYVMDGDASGEKIANFMGKIIDECHAI